MCHAGDVDDVTWLALTISLTVVGAIGTWWAYRHRGAAAALKGAGLTTLPLAAYLTNTLRMFTRIVEAVADWATRLVLSPTVWVGIVLAGVGVLLFGTGRALQARGLGAGGRAPRETDAAPSRDALPPASAKASPKARRGKQSADPALDDDLADVEAILRKRGIT